MVEPAVTSAAKRAAPVGGKQRRRHSSKRSRVDRVLEMLLQEQHRAKKRDKKDKQLGKIMKAVLGALERHAAKPAQASRGAERQRRDPADALSHSEQVRIAGRSDVRLVVAEQCSMPPHVVPLQAILSLASIVFVVGIDVRPNDLAHAISDVAASTGLTPDEAKAGLMALAPKLHGYVSRCSRASLQLVDYHSYTRSTACVRHCRLCMHRRNNVHAGARAHVEQLMEDANRPDESGSAAVPPILSVIFNAVRLGAGAGAMTNDALASDKELPARLSEM